MAIYGNIRDEKLQYDIKRGAAKVSALSSGKIDKYEYRTGESIISPDQRTVIEQANKFSLDFHSCRVWSVWSELRKNK